MTHLLGVGLCRALARAHRSHKHPRLMRIFSNRSKGPEAALVDLVAFSGSSVVNFAGPSA